MNTLIVVTVLIAFSALALFFESSTSDRMMTLRKIIAGCGAIFFAIYGLVVPEARPESLVMTALAVVILCFLRRASPADEARDSPFLTARKRRSASSGEFRNTHEQDHG